MSTATKVVTCDSTIITMNSIVGNYRFNIIDTYRQPDGKFNKQVELCSESERNEEPDGDAEDESGYYGREGLVEEHAEALAFVEADGLEHAQFPEVVADVRVRRGQQQEEGEDQRDQAHNHAEQVEQRDRRLQSRSHVLDVKPKREVVTEESSQAVANVFSAVLG